MRRLVPAVAVSVVLTATEAAAAAGRGDPGSILPVSPFEPTLAAATRR